MKRIFLTLAVMALTIVSFSAIASAKVEIPLENGAQLIIYEDWSEIPASKISRSVPMTIANGSFPAYPSFNYAHGSDGDENIPLGLNNTIRITFVDKKIGIYICVKDVTNNTTHTPLSLLSHSVAAFEIRGLTSNHTYKVGFAGGGSAVTINGTIDVINT